MSTLGDIIQSVRSQIPDPTLLPTVDNANGFTLATLIRWINDAMRVMATSSPIVQDWYGVQSQINNDIYILPDTVLSVEQLWYDLQPCVRAPEAMTIYVNQITSKGYYFGPHSIHATPRLQVWPASDRTGNTTTLTGNINSSITTFSGTLTTGWMSLGFLGIDNEVMSYRTLSSGGTFTNTLRGQAGSVAAAHTAGATITERNIMMKVSRLPTAVATSTDTVEIPVGLTPLIELYVLAKVREAEQESALAMQMRQEFQKSMDLLQNRAQLKGIRQGLQVSSAIGPDLYRGRLFIP
jgi:hypothetical protein